MFRPAFRAATVTRPIPKAQHIGRRFASTRSSKSGTWKGAALRWGAAGTIVYYYNTSTVFAEEPQYAVHAPLETSHESETYRTIDTLAEQRRAQARGHLHDPDAQKRGSTQQTVAVVDGEQVAPDGPGALEEEAGQQGAFNEETGEINWECPCLGGMANGPCGEQFKAAFSCFVYSKEEPKGVDCIEHFKTMQNCFRDHPDIYGAELDDDEVAEVQAEEDRAQASRAQAAEAQSSDSQPSRAKEGKKEEARRPETPRDEDQKRQSTGESQEVSPKAWHDARDANTQK